MTGKITAFISGLIFAIGLGVGGMTQPEKVIGFLDFAGSWDPTLMFVMAGAVAVYLVAFRTARIRSRPLFGPRYELPSRMHVDGRLLGGSALFGIGWGLVGICPGPALTVLGSASGAMAIFVVAMLAGMMLVPKERAQPAELTRGDLERPDGVEDLRSAELGSAERPLAPLRG